MPADIILNDQVAVLAATIGATDTVIPLGSILGPGGTSQFRVVVDSEIMIVTGGSGTASLTVVRGAEGTPAVTHGIGTSVTVSATAGGLNNAYALSATGGATAIDTSTTPQSKTGPLTVPVYDKGGAVYDVRAYGALWDGSTNDTTAIRAAITAATVTGGIVQCPVGTGRSDFLAVPSNVLIRGAGKNRTLLKFINTAAGDALIYNATFRTYAQGQPDPNWAPREDRIGVQSLTLDGNKVNVGTRYGIIFRPCTHVSVTDVRVINTGLQGIMIQHCKGVEVVGCETSGTGGDGIMVSDCVDFRVEGNDIEDSLDYGIEIGAGYDYGSPNSVAAVEGASAEGNVVNNTARNCANFGIAARGYKNATANPTNRPIRGVSITGNTAAHNGTGIVLQELTDDASVVGNTCRSNGSGMLVTVGAGEEAAGFRSTITGNTLEDNTNDGMTAVSAVGITMSGNTIRDNGHNGVAGSFLDSAFLGNVIRNNGTAAAGTYDNLSIQATSQNCEVRGNDLADRGTRTARYDLNGNGQAGIVAQANKIGNVNGVVPVDSGRQSADLGGTNFTTAASGVVTDITGLSVTRTPLVNERATLMLRIRANATASSIVAAYIQTSPVPLVGQATMSSVNSTATASADEEYVVVGSVDLVAGTTYTIKAQGYQNAAGTLTVQGSAQNTELTVVTVPR